MVTLAVDTSGSTKTAGLSENTLTLNSLSVFIVSASQFVAILIQVLAVTLTVWLTKLVGATPAAMKNYCK